MLDVDVWLVGATVKVDDSDLAVLLRAVGDAIADLDLLAIRYCVDGRFYVMGGPRVEAPGSRSPGFRSAGRVTGSERPDHRDEQHGDRPRTGSATGSPSFQ